MSVATEASSTRDMIARRNRLLGPAYRLFYEEPVEFVRGEGVWLYDAAGHRYLDGYNNVASVGHCHPHVVQAITRQAAVLNTHTRYLHETVLDFAEKLLATFPPQIGHVMFTCTGSEANDLALRVARTCTGGTGFIVTANAYHGVTSALAELSPSLGLSLPEGSHVRLVPAPSSAADAGDVIAHRVRAALADMKKSGIRPAALLVDTIFSSDGVFADPPGFLRLAVEAGALPATASSPISSPWASRWATAIRLPGWRRALNCWQSLAGGRATSTRSAATRFRPPQVLRCST